MSVWDDMAHDAGYRGDEARQVAQTIEREERERADQGACPHCGEWGSSRDYCYCEGARAARGEVYYIGKDGRGSAYLTEDAREATYGPFTREDAERYLDGMGDG